jgi:drug/metabolite transporter (DMT)-like permease
MRPDSRPAFSPYAAITVGILAVSTASIFIRYAQEDVPSLVIAMYRLTLATVFIAPAALHGYRQAMGLLSRREHLLIGLSGLFLALHFASWISSLEYTSVASSVVLVTTTPLWVALLSPLVLGERLTRRAVAGLLLALAGGILIGLSDACRMEAGALVCLGESGSEAGGALWGNFLALVGAWMAAGYLLVGRKVRTRLPVVPYVFLVYGVAAVFLIFLVIFSYGWQQARGLPAPEDLGQLFFGYPPQAYLWLVLLAAVPQLVGHSIFNWALAYLPASIVAVTLLGEPVGSTLLAYFLLAETPAAPKLIGAILILTGIVLAAQIDPGSPQTGDPAPG